MTSDVPKKVIPLVEEVARIEKKITTDKVSVRTFVEVETTHLEANLATRSVSVERVSIDRAVDHAPAIRTEGDVSIIPILEERLVVEKKLYLIEEIRITSTETIEKVDLPVDLRRQRVALDKSADSNP